MKVPINIRERLNYRANREISKALQSGVNINRIKLIEIKYTYFNHKLIKKENLKKQIMSILSEAIWNLAKTVHGLPN